MQQLVQVAKTFGLLGAGHVAEDRVVARFDLKYGKQLRNEPNILLLVAC